MKKFIIASLFLCALVAPSFSQAATLAELEAMVAQLQAQIAALQQPQKPTTSCVIFSQNLSLGDGDGADGLSADVIRLQNFLRSQGYFNQAPTGFFGNVTRAALIQYQNNSKGIGSFTPGVLDQETRRYIQERTCGTTPVNNLDPVINSFSGPTSLAVGQRGTWAVNVSVPASTKDISWVVYWGDTDPSKGGVSEGGGVTANAQSSFSATHSYSQAGTYTVKVRVTTSTGIVCITTPCPSGGSAEATMTVVVGSNPRISPITVITPNGGENYLIGSQQTIRWSGGQFSDGSYPGVDVSLTLPYCGVGAVGECEVWYRITEGALASSALSWVVGQALLEEGPLHTVPTGSYRMKVCAENRTDVCDISNKPFTISGTTTTPPSITIITPNGGEILKVGSTITVRWSSINLPVSASIGADLINIDTDEDIALFGSESNDGMTSVKLNMSTPPGRYKVNMTCRASCGVSGAKNDFSDNYFTIISGTVPTPTATATPVPGAPNITSAGHLSDTRLFVRGSGLWSGSTVAIGGPKEPLILQPSRLTYRPDGTEITGWINLSDSLIPKTTYPLVVKSPTGATSNIVQFSYKGNPHNDIGSALRSIPKDGTTIVPGKSADVLSVGFGTDIPGPTVSDMSFSIHTSQDPATFSSKWQLLDDSKNVLKEQVFSSGTTFPPGTPGINPNDYTVTFGGLNFGPNDLNKKGLTLKVFTRSTANLPSNSVKFWLTPSATQANLNNHGRQTVPLNDGGNYPSRTIYLGPAQPAPSASISTNFISSNETVRAGELAGEPDIVDLEIIFDVTASGGEVWVERDFATQGAAPSASVDGQFWATTSDSTTGTSTSGAFHPSAPSLSASGDTSKDDTSGSDQDFHLDYGETRRLTFRVSIPAGGDNVSAGARITGLKWGTLDNTDNMFNLHTLNISNLKTQTVTGLSIH